MPTPRAILSTEPGGPSVPPGARNVVAPVGSPPLRTFREVLYLRFAAGGWVVEKAIATLRASFVPLAYDALHPPAPLAAAGVHAQGGALVVELEAPRRLQSVRLAPGKLPRPGHTLHVHRLDGATLADKPSVTAGEGPPATFALDFVDARCALRLNDPEGQPVPLAAADLQALTVRADLSGARLALAVPPALDAAVPFWMAPGGAAEAFEAEAGAALADALERFSSTPDLVEVALVIGADGPCRVDLRAAEVPYQLRAGAPLGGVDKEVLRFAAAGPADRTLSLALPGRAVVRTAVLLAVPSLRSNRPVTGAPGAAEGFPTPRRGVRLESASWIAQRLAPETAVEAVGVSFGLVGGAPETTLAFEVREDHAGSPRGRTLAAGTISLEVAGRPGWSTGFLDPPVILPAQPCWLLLTAGRGSAVWLTREEKAASLLGLDRSDAPAVPRSLPGLATLHRLVVAADPGAEGPPSPALELRVGDTLVPASPADEDGRIAFDLAAALTRHLESLPPASPQEVPLELMATAPGTVTVYPPRLLFEPPA